MVGRRRRGRARDELAARGGGDGEAARLREEGGEVELLPRGQQEGAGERVEVRGPLY